MEIYNVMADLEDPPTEPKLDNLTESKLDKDFLDGSPQWQWYSRIASVAENFVE